MWEWKGLAPWPQGSEEHLSCGQSKEPDETSVATDLQPFCPLCMPSLLILSTLISKLPAHRSLSLSETATPANPTKGTCYLGRPLVSSLGLQCTTLLPPDGPLNMLFHPMVLHLCHHCPSSSSPSQFVSLLPGEKLLSIRNHYLCLRTQTLVCMKATVFLVHHSIPDPSLQSSVKLCWITGPNAPCNHCIQYNM